MWEHLEKRLSSWASIKAWNLLQFQPLHNSSFNITSQSMNLILLLLHVILIHWRQIPLICFLSFKHSYHSQWVCVTYWIWSILDDHQWLQTGWSEHVSCHIREDLFGCGGVAYQGRSGFFWPLVASSFTSNLTAEMHWICGHGNMNVLTCSSICMFSNSQKKLWCAANVTSVIGQIF